MFEGNFVCKQQGQLNVLKTCMDAFLDALEGKKGKAEEWKIRPHEHIYKLEIEEFDVCYVDGWGNLMLGAEDFEKLCDYRKMLEMFVLGYRERLVQQISAVC